MMTLSIGKTVAPALLVGSVSVAAIGYAVTQMPHSPKVDTAVAGLMSPPSQAETPASAPKAEMAKAEAPKPEVSKSEASKTEAPALASTDSKIAALTADLAGPPPAPPADPSLPAFDLARIEAGGDAVIAGRAAPGATVQLMRNGEKLDQAVADASGQFVMTPPRLPAGSYELSLSSKMPDGTVAMSTKGVPVELKEADATGSVAAPAPSTTASIAAKPQEATAAPSRQTMASTTTDEGSPSAEAGSHGTTRIVSRGDSLWRISRITYGAGEQYAILYRANRDRIHNPNLIHPGQILVLPVKHR